jgi:ABC-2 type transport system ATP-binding protein
MTAAVNAGFTSGASDTALVRVQHATRRHAGRTALEDVSLAVARGEVLALLGVNGAGKSTTLKLLAGTLAPHAGRVRVAGVDLADDPRAARTLIGWLPERAPLYPESTVGEYLAFVARLRGLPRAARARAIGAALERCDLTAHVRRLCGLLSKGEQQRVGLAQAVLHDPPVLLLDEPTSGLDPVHTARLRALILELAPSRAIVLSTHLLPEVQRCATHVAMLHEGRLRLAGPLAAFPGDELERRFLAVALGTEAAA